MANFFVDSVTGSNSDNGTTQALAWATIVYALNQSFSAGDLIIVRLNHSETPTASIAIASDGTINTSLTIQSWSRPVIPDTTITQGDWTNGSTTVDNIVGITCARSDHQGRFATAPDGSKYLITRVVDSNTVILDREYAGSTVTGTSGKFQIEADEWTNPTDVDGWDSDDHTLPLIDFGGGAYGFDVFSDNFWQFKGLELLDGGRSTNQGSFHFRTAAIAKLQGCLISTTREAIVGFDNNGTVVFIDRTIIEGNGTGAGQIGIYNYGRIEISNSAIYNCGDLGLRCINSGLAYLNNVNIGVEVANGDDDISTARTALVTGMDVKLGGSNGDVVIATGGEHSHMMCEFGDYGKVLGDHKTFWVGGSWINVDVGDTGAPSAASSSGKTEDLIEITPNINQKPEAGWSFELFVHEIDTDTSSKTYTYYLQNDGMGTLNDGDAKGDIWLKLEYTDSYDDVTEYSKAEIFSSETTIASRANQTDWDSLSVSCQPAVASRVRITCFMSLYHATGQVYVDPLPVIS